MTTDNGNRTSMRPGASDPGHLIVFDTTLRDGEQSPGISLDAAEKLEIAEQLARVGVDYIEAGFPVASVGDFEAVQAIARSVGNGPGAPAICGLSRTQRADVDRCWQAFLRRFDLEHTFRFFKQVLGWTAPKVRGPAAADRWTWLIIAAYAQLRLARNLAADIRLPWQRPCPPGRLTPARVRRDFRNIRTITGSPAGAPKPGKPGPGRPPGSKNCHPARHHDDPGG